MNPQILNVAIAELPAFIAWFRGAFKKANPDAPEPTEAEVVAAFNAAFFASLAKDDNWLSTHPAPVPNVSPS